MATATSGGTSLSGASRLRHGRGGKYCVAGGPGSKSCTNGQFTKDISMHCFPKPSDDVRRRRWTNFVRRHRPNFSPSEKSFLCSAHFTKTSFHRRAVNVSDSLGGRRILCKDAIPSIDIVPSVMESTNGRNVSSQRDRRFVIKQCIEEHACPRPLDNMQEQLPDSTRLISPDSVCNDAAEVCVSEDNVLPTAAGPSCKCGDFKKRIISLQKRLSWYKKTKHILHDRLAELENNDLESETEASMDVDVETDMVEEGGDESEESGDETGESGDESEDSSDEQDICELDEGDEEWTEKLRQDTGDGKSATDSTKNTINVEPGTTPEAEPKFVVFYSMLIHLFSMFCFQCKGPNPKVHVRRNGTMATVTQLCPTCPKPFQWRTQPFVFGKFPAGNIMMSFGILMSGINISQALLFFRHMGLSSISARTFFYHQRQYLFPSILHYWRTYQNTLLGQLKGLKDTVWSGDGRFDSPGHCAKYGAYTMFCNTISKIAHFELLQSNQSGSSNGMELEGAKRSFAFLKNAGIHVSTFISDRHLGISKWMNDSCKEICHLFDLWHVSKGFTKKLVKAAKEKGCEILTEWTRGIRNHMYWSATSTRQGFGELIVAKWRCLTDHVADKHSGHPNKLFTKCCHGEIKPRKWIKIGTPAYDKLRSLVENTRTLNDVRKLSNDPQTSCLEGFHSTLNHWHPKMIHYSWLGTYCRHVLAILHFNENLHREPRTSKEGKVYYNVKFPKFKLEEEVVKEVPVPPSYDYADQIRTIIFNSSTDMLDGVLSDYTSQVPDTLTSKFSARASKPEAIRKQLERRTQCTPMFPEEQFQTDMEREWNIQQEGPAKKRKVPLCKKCQKPMKGHQRAACSGLEE